MPLTRGVDADSVRATAHFLGVALAGGGAEAVGDLTVNVEAVATAPALSFGREKFMLVLNDAS